MYMCCMCCLVCWDIYFLWILYHTHVFRCTKCKSCFHIILCAEQPLSSLDHNSIVPIAFLVNLNAKLVFLYTSNVQLSSLLPFISSTLCPIMLCDVHVQSPTALYTSLTWDPTHSLYMYLYIHTLYRWQRATFICSSCHLSGCCTICCTPCWHSSLWSPDLHPDVSSPPLLPLSANPCHLPPGWRLWEAESERILPHSTPRKVLTLI